MEEKGIQSRTSSRLAEKRRHSERYDCPCCLQKSSVALPKTRKTINENIYRKAHKCSKDRQEHAILKKKRGRPPKPKGNNSNVYQKASAVGRTANKQVVDANCKNQRKTGNVTPNSDDGLLVGDDLVQSMIHCGQLHSSGTDKMEIIDAVVAVLNTSWIKCLQETNNSWEQELSDVCQVQMSMYNGKKLLISHSIEKIIMARDALIQMLQLNKGWTFSEQSKHSSGRNSLQNSESKECQDVSNIQRQSCQDDYEEADAGQINKAGCDGTQTRIEINQAGSTDAENSETADDSIAACDLNQVRPCLAAEAKQHAKGTKNYSKEDTKVNDVTILNDASMENQKSGEDVDSKCMTQSPAIKHDQRAFSSLKITVEPGEKSECKDSENDNALNITSSGSKLTQNQEHVACGEETGSKMVKEGTLTREELINLIDKLEAGLLTENVNPAEVWKILTKTYTRSARTNKKEVTESDLMLCNLCHEYRGTQAAILSHKRRRHPKVIYRCDLCGKAFGVKYACLMHRMSHLGRGRRHEISRVLQLERQRREGEVKHINLDRMTENIARAGNSTVLKNPERAVHKCKYCNYRGTRIGVTSHALRYHPKHVYKCNECSRTYGTKYQMDIHKESHAMRRLRETRKRQACHDMLQTKPDGSPICLPDEYKHIHKCDICGFMTTKSALSQHKHRHHQEKQFQCDLCKKWFSRRCEFNSHRTSHFNKDGNLRNIRKVDTSTETAEKEQKCNPLGNKDDLVRSETDTAEGSELQCTNTNEEKLEFPEKDGEDSKLCKCDVCGFETTHKGLLMHKNRQHKEARFECDICCKRFRINSILQKHRLTHFTEDGELKPWLRRKCGLEEENLKCEECGIMFKSSRAMEIHVAKKHTKLKKYMCEFCLYRGFTKNDVDIHVARMHKSHDHKCDKCGKAYAFAKELERHLAVFHQGMEQCKCHICGQEFKMIRYLKNHLERHEGKFRCYCSVCGKGFMDNCRLKEHEQTHKPTDERDHKYHCNICKKGFLRRSTWQQHMDCHYKNRCHACDLCGKAFTLPQTLWKHKLRHKAERPYPCGYPGCTKAFFDKTTYQYHYVIHTGQSAHKCNTCGKVFTQAATLRRHVCKMASQHFRNEIGDVDMAASVSEVQPICPKSESLISMIGSSEFSTDVDQAIVIQPEQLALLSQLDNEGQVIQVVDNPDSVENVMIILNETKQETGDVQPVQVQQDAGTMDEVAHSHLAALTGETSQEHYSMPQNEMESNTAQLQQDLETTEPVSDAEVESQQYLCSICEQLFSTWDQIKTHMIKHTGEDSQMTLSVVDPTGNVATEEICDLQLTEDGGHQEVIETKQ